MPAVQLEEALAQSRRRQSTAKDKQDAALVAALARAHKLAKGATLDGAALGALCKGAVARVLARERARVSPDERAALAQRLALDVLARFGARNAHGETVVPLAAVGREWATMRATRLLRESREWKDTADGWRASEGGATVAIVGEWDTEANLSTSPLAVAVLRDSLAASEDGEMFHAASEDARALAAAATEALAADAADYGDGGGWTDTERRRVHAAILGAVATDGTAALAALALETGRTFRAVADGDALRGRDLLRESYPPHLLLALVRDAAQDAGLTNDPAPANAQERALDARRRRLTRGAAAAILAVLRANGGRVGVVLPCPSLPDPYGPGERVRDGRANAPAVGGAAAAARLDTANGAKDARRVALAREDAPRAFRPDPSHSLARQERERREWRRNVRQGAFRESARTLRNALADAAPTHAAAVLRWMDTAPAVLAARTVRVQDAAR